MEGERRERGKKDDSGESWWRENGRKVGEKREKGRRKNLDEREVGWKS